MFDTDHSAAAHGTDTHRADLHCDAYNVAFYELGLRWHWDQAFYQSVLNHADERARLRDYLKSHQPHLLKAYDVEFLADAIEQVKSRCLGTMLASGRTTGAANNWAELQQHQVGA